MFRTGKILAGVAAAVLLFGLVAQGKDAPNAAGAGQDTPNAVGAGQGGETDRAQADKSGFHLFRPTPEALLREMATDRPDKTEGPTTVDAGHFQVEMDFATYTRDRQEGVRTNVWNVAPFNLRVGLLNNLEFDLIFGSYLHETVKDWRARAESRNSGVGDFLARCKINLWGNDGGATALAILPFVKFPTNSGGFGNDSIEGGVLFPLAVKLPAGFELGMETGVEFLRDEVGGGRHAGIIDSVTVAHSLVGKLSGYAEFFSEVSTERGTGWEGTLDFGLTYLVTKNVQLDGGCNFGLTRAADDLNFFTGISFRY
ncbi:MAG: transporter [Chthoniobacterales bacterium]